MSNTFFAAIESLKKGLFCLPFFRKNNNNQTQPRWVSNGAAVFDYDFMMSLDEKEYPKYLAYAYKVKTGKKLNLKHPKNINEKIQWLKLYDNSEIKSRLTDKVLVRDWVKSKIGEEYLKPALWIGDKFDDIPFETLPDSFIVKANHGCKWHFIVKNKNEYLNNENVFKYTKMIMENWLKQSFFGYSDFETQYKNITPKILIEPLLREDINRAPDPDLCIYCANSKNIIREGTSPQYHANLYKKAHELSNILCQGFKFVRIDWMIYKNKLYFGEMTFTPSSGYLISNKELSIYKILSQNLNLK